jgi:hypothetical protein
MPAPKFFWSTGDVPTGYDVISIGWGDGQSMQEATDALRKFADKQGADGVAAVRFTPVIGIDIQTQGKGYSVSVYGDVSGCSTTRWVAYGTLVKRK